MADITTERKKIKKYIEEIALEEGPMHIRKGKKRRKTRRNEPDGTIPFRTPLEWGDIK